MKKNILVFAALFMFSGCYHVQITTGLEPSAELYNKHEIKWAHGFLYGLVPPALVKAEEECEHGAAAIETRRSFLNYVASWLSSGIYTPMHIVVTCAEERPDLQAHDDINISISQKQTGG